MMMDWKLAWLAAGAGAFNAMLWAKAAADCQKRPPAALKYIRAESQRRRLDAAANAVMFSK